VRLALERIFDASMRTRCPGPRRVSFAPTGAIGSTKSSRPNAGSASTPVGAAPSAATGTSPPSCARSPRSLESNVHAGSGRSEHGRKIAPAPKSTAVVSKAAAIIPKTRSPTRSASSEPSTARRPDSSCSTAWDRAAGSWPPPFEPSSRPRPCRPAIVPRSAGGASSALSSPTTGRASRPCAHSSIASSARSSIIRKTGPDPRRARRSRLGSAVGCPTQGRAHRHRRVCAFRRQELAVRYKANSRIARAEQPPKREREEQGEAIRLPA